MTKSTRYGLIGFSLLIVVALFLSTRGPQLSLAPQAATNVLANPSNLPILANAMPEFQGISKWWNTADGQPLTPDELKGKVVLVDFWTYSCINCLRSLTFVKA